MTSINSDQMSAMVLASLNKSNATMQESMQRLSTGKRINQAGDDAAGLSISAKLRAQVDSLNAAIKNSSDALAMVSTIEGALVETTTILQRMRQLSVQSSSDSLLLRSTLLVRFLRRTYPRPCLLQLEQT